MNATDQRIEIENNIQLKVDLTWYEMGADLLSSEKFYQWIITNDETNDQYLITVYDGYQFDTKWELSNLLDEFLLESDQLYDKKKQEKGYICIYLYPELINYDLTKGKYHRFDTFNKTAKPIDKAVKELFKEWEREI